MTKKFLFINLSILAAAALSSASAGRPAIPAVAGDPFPVSKDLVGYNAQLCPMGSDPWSHTDFTEAVKALRPSTLRYPGGTVGNYWDWELGWISPDFPEDHLIKWVRGDGLQKRPHRYTLEHLKKGWDAVGFEPVYCLNMMDTKEDQDGDKLAMTVRALRHAKEIGLPIKYLELGNEYYFGLPIETYNFRTPERYGEVCTLWIDTLKKEFPEARFAIIGGGPMNNHRNNNWTTRALSTVEGEDAVTIHTYTDTGLFGLEKKKDFVIEEEGWAELSAKVKAMTPEARSAYALERLATPEGFADMMHTGWTCFPRKLKNTNVPDDVKEIWATEWNITHRAGAEVGTWANALFIALVYDSFLQDGRVTISSMHNVHDNAFPVLYSGPGELKNVKHRSVKLPEGYTPGPAALPSIWLQNAKQGADLAQKIEFPGAPRLVSRYGEMPSLLGWQFGTEDEPAVGVFLINLNSSAMPVRLPSSAALSGVAYTSNPVDYTIETPPQEIPVEPKDGYVELPPYSITVLR